MAQAWIEVPLSSKKYPGRVALLDVDDWMYAQSYRWYVHPGVRTEYARTNTWDICTQKGHGVLLHQMLTGWVQADHHDGDGLNNRRSNLRPASGAQNNGNRRPQRAARSRFKGVSWETSARKWRARIGVEGRIVSLGCFSAEEEAARAYDKAAAEHFGEYAQINFPQALEGDANE